MSITGASESLADGEETDRQPSAPDYDNPEQAKAIREGLRAQKEQQHEEASKAERDKQAILSAIESETCHVRLGGKRVEFTLLWGDEEQFIEDVVGEFVGVDDEAQLNEEQYERYQTLNTRIAGMLATHAVEDAFDQQFFEKLPQAKRETAIMDLRAGGIEGSRAKNS